MKKCMILMGRYGGQVLTLDDLVAQGAIADGWATLLDNKTYPYDVNILLGGDRPDSLRVFEYQISTGRTGTEELRASPIIKISKGNEAVVTVAEAEAPKFESADSVYFEGTGNAKFDNLTFGDIRVEGPNIVIVGYTNSSEVNNRGTVIRAMYGPNPGIIRPFYSLIHDPNPERKRT